MRLRVGEWPIVGAPRDVAVWVELAHDGPEEGTQAAPCQTLEEGLAASPPGGLVLIKAGQTSATHVTDPSVRIDAHGVTVVIGS